MGMGLSGPSRGGRRARRLRAPVSEINVTPLVDVMLVLLIIFMVTAPLLATGVPIDLPESRANPLSQESQETQISIDHQGYIYIDGDEVPIGGFPEALERLRGNGVKPPPVVLRADKGLEYGRIMAVMGELNRAGFNSISLVTNGSVTPP